MTHRINLRDWESAGLLAGRITALCRVVRPQPFNQNVCVIQHRDKWLMAMTCDKLPIAHPPLLSPFGVPGDEVLGRECFGWVSGAGRRLVFRADGTPVCRYYGNKICGMLWNASTTMPDSLVRHRLTTKSVWCCRVQELDAWAMSAFGVPYKSAYGCWGNDDYDGFLKHEEGLLAEAYKEQFDRDNQRNKWADNPWVWVAEVARG